MQVTWKDSDYYDLSTIMSSSLPFFKMRNESDDIINLGSGQAQPKGEEIKEKKKMQSDDNKSLLGTINPILFIYKLNFKFSPGKGKLSCCVQSFSAIICRKSHP